jgi:hypothetical protein
MALLARLAVLTALLRPQAAIATDEAPAAAMAPEVRAQYDAGMAHYTAREFAAAARAFHAAYAVDPRREILFAEAQATRLAGDCAAAVGLYQAFLATQPPQQQVEATQLALARCRDVQAPAPLLPPVLASSAGSTPPSPPPPHPIWWRDRVGLSLAAGALVSWGIALGFGVAAARADKDARAVANYDVAEERRHAAEDRARWAQRAAIAGAAFTTAATGRFVWVGLHRATPIVGVEGRF